jgi:Flp pilus assembly protein CpaB
MKARIVVGAGVVIISGIIVWGVLDIVYGFKRGHSILQQRKTINVVVTKETVWKGTRLFPPDRFLTLEEFPKGREPKRAFTSFELLKDRMLNKTLHAGSPVTLDDLEKLPEEGRGNGLPRGIRAMRIRVQASGFVAPRGSRVDVLVITLNDPNPDGSVLVQNVGLLFLDVSDQKDADGNTFNEATIGVTNEEAGILTEASKIQLRLRYHPAEDQEGPQEAKKKGSPEELSWTLTVEMVRKRATALGVIRVPWRGSCPFPGAPGIAAGLPAVSDGAVTPRTAAVESDWRIALGRREVCT